MPAWAGRLVAGFSRNGTYSAETSHRLQPVLSLTVINRRLGLLTPQIVTPEMLWLE